MAFLDEFWYQFKTFIWKKVNKQNTMGFVKLGVQWAERDINSEFVAFGISCGIWWASYKMPKKVNELV